MLCMPCSRITKTGAMYIVQSITTVEWTNRIVDQFLFTGMQCMQVIASVIGPKDSYTAPLFTELTHTDHIW